MCPANGAGCIVPTQQTVETGIYQPLSRPLFIYVRKDAATKPQLVTFRSEQWAVDGISETGVPDNSLQLTRRQQAAPGAGKPAGAEMSKGESSNGSLMVISSDDPAVQEQIGAFYQKASEMMGG